MERIKLRITNSGANSEEEYLERLRSDPDELSELVKDVTIKYSCFFRDPLVFDYLYESLLPDLIEHKRNEQELRIWSCGCAEGEEPYSLGILLRDLLKHARVEWNIYLFATDICRQSLETAARGRYNRQRLYNSRLQFVDDYFTPVEGNMFEVKEEIRSMVSFSYHNLLDLEQTAPQDSIFGEFDMIVCRNVLLYLDEKHQNLVLEKLRRSLVVGGFLIMGSVCGLPLRHSNLYERMTSRHHIYKKE